MSKLTIIAFISILYLQHILSLPTPDADRVYDKQVSWIFGCCCKSNSVHFKNELHFRIEFLLSFFAIFSKSKY